MKDAAKKYLKNYAMIILGCAIYALAFDWCFEPNAIGFGGITGVAQIVNHFFPQFNIGILVILFNIPLFLLGWKLFGAHMLISSLSAMAISSLMLDGLAMVVDFPPMEDTLLACVVGGVLLGLSLGIIFLQGATTGGTEIVARLLKLKLSWLPMGKCLLAADLVVVALVAAVFRNLGTALYGVVALYLSTFVMDQVLYGTDNAKVAYIISDHPEDIARVIINDLDRSFTYLQGEGGYSGMPKKVIMCAFKQRQIVTIKETIRRVDPNAFMIVTSAHEVLGEGFGSYRTDAL
ncbi:MAG: YitT family protein [Oscillospiraceae bacterium]|nr:YitT family protein [Oscillospiraceae bacterium]